MNDVRRVLLFCLLFSHAMLLLGLDVTNASTAIDESPDESHHRETVKIPFEKAIARISVALKARIIVFCAPERQQVIFDTGHRSSMDQLKSILKGCSYAIIYNDPSPSYDRFGSSPISDGEHLSNLNTHEDTATGDDTESNLLKAQKIRLVARIEKLKEGIASGNADRFFEHWTKIRDPKYIYNHHAELERLQEELVAMDQ